MATCIFTGSLLTSQSLLESHDTNLARHYPCLLAGNILDSIINKMPSVFRDLNLSFSWPAVCQQAEIREIDGSFSKSGSGEIREVVGKRRKITERIPFQPPQR